MEFTRVDQIDRSILALLAKDARTTNKDLALAVGLSQSACLERTRRLTAEGLLRGTHADVEPEAFGIGVQAFVAVRLKRHTRTAVAKFERACLTQPQVIALYHLTGREDFLAHVVARDMDDLRDFTLDALTSLGAVDRVETSLLFRSTKQYEWPDLSEPKEG